MDVPRGARSALPRGCLRPSTRGAAPRRAPFVVPTALAESSSEKSSEVGRRRSVYLKNMTLAELEDYCEAELVERRAQAPRRARVDPHVRRQLFEPESRWRGGGQWE